MVSEGAGAPEEAVQPVASTQLRHNVEHGDHRPGDCGLDVSPAWQRSHFTQSPQNQLPAGGELSCGKQQNM